MHNPSDVAFSRPTLGAAEERAALGVLRSGWIVGGPRVSAFEEAFAERCGVRHAVAVSSWTAGAFLTLHAWGIGPGDEVIVPSLTFIATVNVIRHVGAIPIFADVDRETFNVTVDDVASKIGPRTRAIMPVDQIGLPCDLVGISRLAHERGLLLLDDAACAFGSKVGDLPVGSFGDAAVFSLHARKVITTGEGGMIVTNDTSLADRLRRLRQQGMSRSDYARHGASPLNFERYEEVGYNARMTDIQAAIGLEQLGRAASILEKRAVIAARYTAHLNNSSLVATPHVPAGVTPNWQSYQLTVREHGPVDRDSIMASLFARGIHVRRGVMASHREPAYAGHGMHLPNTEWIADHTLQLPIFPDFTTDQQDRVISAVREIAKGAGYR